MRSLLCQDFEKCKLSGYSQGGGIGRNASLPCIIKRRITTNLKKINNQKCQKIKLLGTPTTKELKKHSPRPVGGAEMGNKQLRETTRRWGRAGRTGNQRLKASCKILWGLQQWRNSQSHRTVHWKVGLELSKWGALFPLWPLPHRQHYNATKRVAPPW